MEVEYQQVGDQQTGGATAAPASSIRIVLMPGFEFVPSRKYRYGLHALSSASLILIAFALVELRDCSVSFSPTTNLKGLQALHLALFLAAFTLYILSLFGIADFLFQYKLIFYVGALMVYALVGLMVWMCYEAAVSPCQKTLFFPIDTTISGDVFSRGDGVGIIVLLLDIFAALLMVSAGTSFLKRY